MMLTLSFLLNFSLTAAIAAPLRGHIEDYTPAPPTPEPISITTLPLPPVIKEDFPGACTAETNPHSTGCTTRSTGLQGGTFIPDGDHVVATIRFAGAPDVPNPTNVYSGQQLILVKADGSLFPNGDAWKCITCGVLEENRPGVDLRDIKYNYPQAFWDGKRLLAGTYIIDCGDTELASEDCTPEKTTIHSIRLDNEADESGPGAQLRELRLHPDNEHLGLNVFSFIDGKLGQNAYIGRLNFNPAPKTGSNTVPRYDLTHVNQLNPNAPSPLEVVNRNELRLNSSAITIGELRGFSGSGDEVLYVGYPRSACNIDVFAAHLVTGRVRRLTSHPGYVDPVQMSPDDRWMVIMDTRSTNRTLFMDGLTGVPPLTDVVTTTACSSVRNNGNRRFFQPWLLDRYGDRGEYFGQEINRAKKGVAGSGDVDDPEWNGGADPWFSPDGTKITYWQAQTVPPACGGSNPLPCYKSQEPGGRQERLMVAHLTSRKTSPRKEVLNVPDRIPWAVPYEPGKSLSGPQYPQPGTYILHGKFSGHAIVDFRASPNSSVISTVAATFKNFSDDDLRFVSGHQDVSQSVEGFTLDHTKWDSDVVQTGVDEGWQRTSPEGFEMKIDVLKNIFEANGTLETEVDGVVYRQPGNGM